MSMKVPVLISDTIGFWDKEMFINNENIFFISDNNLDTWVDRIQKILSDTQLTNMVSLNGNKTAVENYDSEYFYNSLNKIIFNS